MLRSSPSVGTARMISRALAPWSCSSVGPWWSRLARRVRPAALGPLGARERDLLVGVLGLEALKKLLG
eukprot:3041749-Alexandrium_andersonii.AAC.1